MDDRQILDSAYGTWEAEARGVSLLRDTVDAAALVAAARLIARCEGAILLSGCGTSGAAAQKIAHSLCCIERPAVFLSPSDAVHGGLGLLRPDDILILISKGGGTAELLGMTPACRSKGAKLISVTENPVSALAQQADLTLAVRVDREPCPFNMLATASTLAVVAVFDAICIAVMGLTGYTREQFAVIHPGGAVGERLLGGEAARQTQYCDPSK